MPILLILIFVPLVELYVLIAVGTQIGGLATVLLTLATAAVGILLVRHQGLDVLRRAQADIAASQASGEPVSPPVEAVFEGLCLLIAGICLLIPGFVTDSFGFLLLIPGLRRSVGSFLWSGMASHGRVFVRTGPRPRQGDGRSADDVPPVIDGDFRRLDDKPDDKPDDKSDDKSDDR